MRGIEKLVALSLFITISSSLMSQNSAGKGKITAASVMETIIKNTGTPVIPNTVDVIIKEGNPETPVKGIATTMFATMEVLNKAVEKNCNMIIVHEPLYYYHLDETTQFQNDPVFL